MIQIDSVVDQINHLPGLPEAMSRIVTVVSDKNKSVTEISQALRLDPAISGKVLRLANSAYIGMPRTVSSIDNAVVILGQQRIQSIAFLTVALDSFKHVSGLPFRNIDFWRHSVTTGLICELVARHIKRYDSVEPGELFCAGLLHDIGKLAIGGFQPACITGAVTESKRSDTPFFKAEKPESSHFTIGALLAQKWNYPPDLRNAILYHHDPSSAEPFMKMASIVHVSDIMAHIMGLKTLPDEKTPEFEESAVSCIGLQPESLREIASKALDDEKRIESLLEIVRQDN